ncbi:MAG: PKD domain-containing protein [Microthrixaceae bacterium]|nr:PKD domain-containing protein [Microthrixaceae bacterium]
MRYKRWMVVSLASCVAIAAACVPKPGVPANAAPVATISATPDTGSAPLPVQYSAGGSVDPDGTIVDHLWTFGDGSDPVHGVDVMHTYEHEGTYTVILTVTDNRGAVGSAQFELTVNPRPPATLASQEQIILNPVGDPIAVYDTGPWDRYELREPGAVGYDPATDSWIGAVHRPWQRGRGQLGGHGERRCGGLRRWRELGATPAEPADGRRRVGWRGSG